jgi:hypothetical protein
VRRLTSNLVFTSCMHMSTLLLINDHSDCPFWLLNAVTKASETNYWCFIRFCRIRQNDMQSSYSSETVAAGVLQAKDYQDFDLTASKRPILYSPKGLVSMTKYRLRNYFSSTQSHAQLYRSSNKSFASLSKAYCEDGPKGLQIDPKPAQCLAARQ